VYADWRAAWQWLVMAQLNMMPTAKGEFQTPCEQPTSQCLGASGHIRLQELREAIGRRVFGGISDQAQAMAEELWHGSNLLSFCTSTALLHAARCTCAGTRCGQLGTLHSPASGGKSAEHHSYSLAYGPVS
jgi:hypothetical protein